ncbi:MAG: NUDIX domain-containing protein [Candidatus Woesearchaeota archaeon]
MTTHSSGFNNPIPATDAIIEYEGGIVLITRKNPPYGLAIPGGFAEGGLTLEENVRKEALEETGLTYIVKKHIPFAISDKPKRDPRAHIISIAYVGRGYGELVAGDDAAAARVYSFDEVMHLAKGGEIDGMRLAFDHAAILGKYLAERPKLGIDKPLGKAGVIGRFRPPHLGTALLLEALCEQAEHAIIGIGSANKYNCRNPFTAEEAKQMVDLLLKPRFSNYEFVEVQDYGHIPEHSDGKKWVEEVANSFGALDAFVSGNNYVHELLVAKYPVLNSYDIIPRGKWVKASGTMVRQAMAAGRDWKMLVPEAVAGYIERNRLDQRFRKEFGLETIARMADEEYLNTNTAAERQRVKGG